MCVVQECRRNSLELKFRKSENQTVKRGGGGDDIKGTRKVRIIVKYDIKVSKS